MLTSFNKKSKSHSQEDGLFKFSVEIQAGEELPIFKMTNGSCSSDMEKADGTTSFGYQNADYSSIKHLD